MDMLGEENASMSWQRVPVIQENTVGPQKRNTVAPNQAVCQSHLQSSYSLIALLCPIMDQETAFLASNFFLPSLLSFMFRIKPQNNKTFFFNENTGSYYGKFLGLH